MSYPLLSHTIQRHTCFLLVPPRVHSVTCCWPPALQPAHHAATLLAPSAWPPHSIAVHASVWSVHHASSAFLNTDSMLTRCASLSAASLACRSEAADLRTSSTAPSVDDRALPCADTCQPSHGSTQAPTNQPANPPCNVGTQGAACCSFGLQCSLHLSMLALPRIARLCSVLQPQLHCVSHITSAQRSASHKPTLHQPSSYMMRLDACLPGTRAAVWTACSPALASPPPRTVLSRGASSPLQHLPEPHSAAALLLWRELLRAVLCLPDWCNASHVCVSSTEKEKHTHPFTRTSVDSGWLQSHLPRTSHVLAAALPAQLGHAAALRSLWQHPPSQLPPPLPNHGSWPQAVWLCQHHQEMKRTVWATRTSFTMASTSADMAGACGGDGGAASSVSTSWLCGRVSMSRFWSTTNPTQHRYHHAPVPIALSHSALPSDLQWCPQPVTLPSGQPLAPLAAALACSLLAPNCLTLGPVLPPALGSVVQPDRVGQCKAPSVGVMGPTHTQ